MSSRHAALITGTRSGIGAVFADGFVRRGPDVVPKPLGSRASRLEKYQVRWRHGIATLQGAET